MNRMTHTVAGLHAEADYPLALHIIPPIQTSQEQLKIKATLEAAMQSLVLDKQHPVALELAGTGSERSFIARATSQTALDHVEALLRSQYPQIEIRQLHAFEDPFRLEAHEDVSAVELVSGTEAYLPLRTWQENKQEQDMDPILTLLAALAKLTEGMRAIAQIGLVPAKADWSREHLRKSIEDALEPEKRTRQENDALGREAMQATNWAITKTPWESLSTPVIIIGLVLGGIFAFARGIIPGWVWGAAKALFEGRNPNLTAGQIFLLVASIGGIALGGLLIYVLLEQVRGRFFGTPIYDKQVVAKKTARMAYRARVRLYIIGPKARGEVRDVHAAPHYSITEAAAGPLKGGDPTGAQTPVGSPPLRGPVVMARGTAVA